jgi:hypothetical protein
MTPQERPEQPIHSRSIAFGLAVFSVGSILLIGGLISHFARGSSETLDQIGRVPPKQGITQIPTGSIQGFDENSHHITPDLHQETQNKHASEVRDLKAQLTKAITALRNKAPTSGSGLRQIVEFDKALEDESLDDFKTALSAASNETVTALALELLKGIEREPFADGTNSLAAHFILARTLFMHFNAIDLVPSTQIIQAISTMLTSSDPYLRLLATTLPYSMHVPQLASALELALGSDNDEYAHSFARVQVIRALGVSGSPESIPALTRFGVANGEHYWVAKSIAALGEAPRTIPAILELARSDTTGSIGNLYNVLAFEVAEGKLQDNQIMSMVLSEANPATRELLFSVWSHTATTPENYGTKISILSEVLGNNESLKMREIAFGAMISSGTGEDRINAIRSGRTRIGDDHWAIHVVNCITLFSEGDFPSRVLHSELPSYDQKYLRAIVTAVEGKKLTDKEGTSRVVMLLDKLKGCVRDREVLARIDRLLGGLR